MKVTPDVLPPLTDDDRRRYGRHLALPQVGVDGQRRLRAARVLLVGAGGLGSPAALYLAAAGVGTIGIIDPDVVDESNLQRQILHGARDVGRLKVESARERLAELDPRIVVHVRPERLTAANARAIIREYDVVVDGSDNFATRYVVNDACVLEGKPDVHGSIVRFEGQASVFATADGPCYRCIFPDPPPSDLAPDCAHAGVLGVLPGLVGTIQATEALKLVLGIGDTLAGRLLLVDALAMEMRTIALERDPTCPACGTRTIAEVEDTATRCATPATAEIPEMTPSELAVRLAAPESLQLLDVREPREWEIARLPHARLVPLATLDGVLPALDPARDTVVYCRSGIRSAMAVRRLRDAGFERVWNLTGGIARWSEDVDPTVPRY